MKLLKAAGLITKDFLRSNTAEFLGRAILFLVGCFIVGILGFLFASNFVDGVFEDDIVLASFFDSPRNVFSLFILGLLTVSAIMGAGLVVVILVALVSGTVKLIISLPRRIRLYVGSIKERLNSEI